MPGPSLDEQPHAMQGLFQLHFYTRPTATGVRNGLATEFDEDACTATFVAHAAMADLAHETRPIMARYDPAHG